MRPILKLNRPFPTIRQPWINVTQDAYNAHLHNKSREWKTEARVQIRTEHTFWVGRKWAWANGRVM